MDKLNQNPYEYCKRCGMGVQDVIDDLCTPCDKEVNQEKPMTLFKPKQGEMILVGQYNPVEREFVAMDGEGYLCRGEAGTGYLFWRCAKPLPAKPEPIPFTHETW